MQLKNDGRDGRPGYPHGVIQRFTYDFTLIKQALNKEKKSAKFATIESLHQKYNKMCEADGGQPSQSRSDLGPDSRTRYSSASGEMG